MVRWPASRFLKRQHGRNAIQVLLAMLVLVLLQGIANPQHILNRRTSQGRPAGDLEIASPVGFGGLAVPVGDIQRDRLARSQPLVTGMAMNSGHFNGLRENPGDVVNRETADIKFFVPDRHGGSNPISISIPSPVKGHPTATGGAPSTLG